LPGDRVLIAEYANNRVTERDLQGNILWEVGNLPGLPVNVQRLANGNTFIVLYGPAARKQGALLEVDPQGKTVASFSVAGGGAMAGPAAGPAARVGKAGVDYVLAGHKAADGKMVCLVYDGSCVWLDATGKELKRFLVPRAKTAMASTLGGIDATAKGSVLFAQSDSTVEYDMDGKIVWQANVSASSACRLANGNTLVVAANGGVVELDSAGRTVWQYDPPAGFQVIRAKRK